MTRMILRNFGRGVYINGVTTPNDSDFDYQFNFFAFDSEQLHTFGHLQYHKL